FRVPGNSLAGSAMDLSPAWGQNAFVDRFAGQSMDEADMRPISLRFDQIGVDQSLNDSQECLFIDLRELRPESERNIRADHGGDFQCTTRLVPKPADTAIDHLPDQSRDNNSVELS